MSFHRVCKSWRAAGPEAPGSALVVKGSKMGKALSTALVGQSAEARERIKSLTLLMEGKVAPDGRGRTAAGLVAICTKLERLHLSLVDSLVLDASKDAPFGKALLDAISSKSTLRRLELHGQMEARAGVFANLILGLYGLNTLIAPTLVLTHTGGIKLPSTPRWLKAVEFNDLHPPLLLALVSSSAKRLTHLRLGLITSGFQTLIEHLTPLAPQLVVLEAVSTSYHMVSPFMSSFASKLKRVTTLTLGLEGFDHSLIFSQLAELKTVRELTISVTETFSYLQIPTSPSLESARRMLADLTNLNSLTLPAELVFDWTADEVEDVELDAEEWGMQIDFTC